MSYQSKLAIQLESEKFLLISRITKLSTGIRNEDVTLIIAPLNSTSDDFNVHVCDNRFYTILGHLEVSSAALVHFKTCPELMIYENILSNTCPQNPLELLKASRIMDKFCHNKTKATTKADTKMDELFKAKWNNDSDSENKSLNRTKKLKVLPEENKLIRENLKILSKECIRILKAKEHQARKSENDVELIFLSSNFKNELCADSQTAAKRDTSNTTELSSKDDDSEYVMIICDTESSTNEKASQDTDFRSSSAVSKSSQCTPRLLLNCNRNLNEINALANGIYKTLKISESTITLVTPRQSTMNTSRVDEITQTETKDAKLLRKQVQFVESNEQSSDAYIVAIGVKEHHLAFDDKEPDFPNFDTENTHYKISKIFAENSNDYVLGLYTADGAGH